MEITKIETALVSQVVAAQDLEKLAELSEIQLALVGGGVGEATPY